MRPRTATQKEVVALSEQLPPLTLAQAIQIRQPFWDEKRYMDGWANPKTGVHTCTLCGHQWTGYIDETAICPHCGKHLIITKCRKTRPQNNIEGFYSSVIQEFQGWQVVRVFCVRRFMRSGSLDSEFIYFPVQEIWMDEKHQIMLSASKVMYSAYYRDGMQYSAYSDLTLRSQVEYIDTKADIIESVIPIIQRNGFDGDCRDWQPAYLFHKLLTDNQFESYWKRKLFYLCDLQDNGRANQPQYQKPIKDFIRTKGNWSSKRECDEWFDMIDMMIRLGKDTNKTSLTCPDDIHKKHQQYSDALAVIRAREQRERDHINALKKAERLKELNKRYIKERKKFFEMQLATKTLNARVLKNIKEFEDEGVALDNCVFTSEYYNMISHPNSLILTIRKPDDKRVEVCELSLSTFKIIQCYGIHNQHTKYHRECMKLINDNIHIIKQYNDGKHIC